MKATYQASKAEAGIGEAVSGISESMTDAGMTMQRAQDKIAQMQARAGAVDELLASGALPDMTGTQADDIQQQLNATSAQSEVDAQLAAMKAELASAPATQALPAPGDATAAAPSAAAAAPAAVPATGDDDVADGTIEDETTGGGK
jgi:phage shock protein A